MAEREQREQREEGGDSQTAESREGETMDEAHTEPEGAARQPGPGHPHPGEGVGLPEQGPGRAAMESTPPIGTEDQGEPTQESAEQKGFRDAKEE
jgi:hypothetical protein